MIDGNKINFVAELTINHLGMVNIAEAMIKSAKNAGADYIKIKLKDVGKYYDNNKNFRGYKFEDYRKSLELCEDGIAHVNLICKKYKIKWFCTIHDNYALNIIKKYKPDFYKIASMDGSNYSLIDNVIKTCKVQKKVLIYSTGGTNKKSISKIISKTLENNVRLYLLHAVAIYPTPDGMGNINYIQTLIDNYKSKNVSIGYSGHEKGFAASIFASRFDISMIERHFTLSRDLKIHHIDAALLPLEFKQMINIIKSITKEDIQTTEKLDKNEINFLKNKDYS